MIQHYRQIYTATGGNRVALKGRWSTKRREASSIDEAVAGKAHRVQLVPWNAQARPRTPRAM